MDTSRETFHKSERLCSTKTIADLFDNGNIFYSSIFKVVWRKSLTFLPFPAQIAFSVSKKGFRLAVTRNQIKRRMREAYRRNKQMFYNYLSSEKIQITFIIILRETRVPDYQTIEKSIKEMLDKFILLIKESEKKC